MEVQEVQILCHHKWLGVAVSGEVPKNHVWGRQCGWCDVILPAYMVEVATAKLGAS